jgi:hypothetical protein
MKQYQPLHRVIQQALSQSFQSNALLSKQHIDNYTFGQIMCKRSRRHKLQPCTLKELDPVLGGPQSARQIRG